MGEEVKDAFTQTLKNRLADSFVASFAISFTLYNFRLFLVIFGDGKFNDKIRYIEAELYQKGWNQAIFFPLVAALVYTIIWPLVNEFTVGAFQRWLGRTQRRRDYESEKKETVPIQDQEQFFAKYESEVRLLTDRLSTAVEARKRDYEKTEEAKSDLAQRLRAQVWRSLAMRTGFSPAEVEAVFRSNLAPLDETLVERGSKVPELHAVGRVLEAWQGIGHTADMRKLYSKEQLKDLLKGQASDFETIFEILSALDWIGPVNKADKCFEIFDRRAASEMLGTRDLIRVIDDPTILKNRPADYVLR